MNDSADGVSRRGFLRATAAGTAGTAVATGTASGQSNGTETDDGGGGLPGSGQTTTVTVGPGGDLVFDPETAYVQPGETVVFEWESDFHNVVVDAQPDGANWEGTPGGAGTTYNTGYSYEHTFTQTGTYEYYCDPHLAQGMEASIVVNESGEAPQPEGGAELSPHEMGVPFQAHFVGIATVLMLIVSTVFTFFVLKYGESPHASAPKE